MQLLEYYGTDIVSGVLLCIQMWMMSLNYRSAFLVGACSSLFGVAFGLIVGSPAVVIVNSICFLFNVKAWFARRVSVENSSPLG